MNANDRLQDALRVLREFTTDIEAVAPLNPVQYLERDWPDLAGTYINAKKVLEDWRYERE